MDIWTIVLAVWLPVAGITLALCLYGMTENGTERVASGEARKDSDPRSGAASPSAE